MFVRTQRLTLRPGWNEDAPAIARAIGHAQVCERLAQVPWPYELTEAQAFLAAQREARYPALLIFEHVGPEVRLIGATGINARDDGSHALGYWLTPAAWGRGYATEAAAGVVRMARESLRLKRLVAEHFIDNPASGRVLRKLGFRPTGAVVPRFARARGCEVASVLFELDLQADAPDRCHGIERIAA